jgi:hypothetical protein
MQNAMLRKGLIVGIILSFVGSSVISAFNTSPFRQTLLENDGTGIKVIDPTKI